VDTDFLILSDANTEFIQAFFDGRPQLLGVDGRVHVISNPARVDPATGRLMIHRYSRRHGDTQPEEQHQCQSGYCAVNMCKGRELVKFIQYRRQRPQLAQTGVIQLPSHRSWNDLSTTHEHHHPSSKLDAIQCHYDMVVYVGDGKNDYCPMTRLRATDMACIRRHRALDGLVDGGKIAQPDIQARRVYWHDSETVREAIHEWVSKRNVQK
jgi:pyridoxal phosphate phosphatase PHOSPHO2